MSRMGRGIPLFSLPGDQEERRSCPSGVRGRASAENENDFGAFYTRKPPVVNRILLDVVKILCH